LPEILPEALSAARAIQDESYRALALRNLAPHLPETLLKEVLSAARALQSEDSRALALSTLAPHLPETLLKEALSAARAIQNESYCASALSGIIPLLKSSSFNFSFWKENLRLLVYHDRENLLKDISELSSVVIALGGREALAQTARAITDVGRQWS
jgi:vesicle coat complex subunit